MSHEEGGGQKSAKKCHALFEWPHRIVKACINTDKRLFKDFVSTMFSYRETMFFTIVKT